MSDSAVQPEQRVLSTMHEDGSRRWLRPRLSLGRFHTRRQFVAYGLIAIFALIPYFKINEKPLILLDIINREFTFFGFTFFPTDTLVLALFILGIFITILLVTALLGRIWCGWGCPQTVYMEFVYRPIERYFIGAPGHRAKTGWWRRPGMYLSYLAVSAFLAHVFLAYFVGVDALLSWTTQSPFEHPASFLVMVATTGLMMFDFAFFREQTCIVACPYGRLQSAMIDRNSLIISYDEARGEPRGKKKRTPKTDDAAPGDISLKTVPQDTGDCVDCFKCVTTCPTGIDIRMGLQMECIGCAQCIDACDSVMDKLGRARGLIRYTSQASLQGEKNSLLRPRTLFYPTLLVIIGGLLVGVLATKGTADVSLIRAPGAPFMRLDSGEISNQVRVKVANRENREARYQLEMIEPAGGRIIATNLPIVAGPRERTDEVIVVAVPAAVFTDGRADIKIRVFDEEGFSVTRRYHMVGPYTSAGSMPEATPAEEEQTDDQ